MHELGIFLWATIGSVGILLVAVAELIWAHLDDIIHMIAFIYLTCWLSKVYKACSIYIAKESKSA